MTMATIFVPSANKCMFGHSWELIFGNQKTHYFTCRKCNSRKAEQNNFGYQPIDWAFLQKAILDVQQQKPETQRPRIVAAANKSKKDGLIVVGARHFDSLMRAQINAAGRLSTEFNDQGFIDQFGNFYSREEAFIIAGSNGQIIRRCGGDDGCLFSENLY